MNYTGKQIVIFDSNAYRYLVKGVSHKQVGKRMSKILALEKKNNIIALMSPMVLRELMGHLISRKDSHYDRCLKAIKAMYLHTAEKGNFRQLADTNLLISKALFNAEVPGETDYQRHLGQIASQLVTGNADRVLRRFQTTIIHNRRFLDRQEGSFAKQVKSFFQQADPSAKGWRLFIDDKNSRAAYLSQINTPQFDQGLAQIYYEEAYLRLLKANAIAPVPDQPDTDRISFLQKHFAAMIALWKEVLRRPVFGEFNPYIPQNANFIWDIQLMAAVGANSINGGKLMVVTTDGAMHSIAKLVRSQHSIYTFDDYVDYLGRPDLKIN